MEERINIMLMNLPSSVRGFVVQTFDDSGESFYNVCINENKSEEVRVQTMRHEFAHIVNGDFDSEEEANIIEAQRAKEFPV